MSKQIPTAVREKIIDRLVDGVGKLRDRVGQGRRFDRSRHREQATGRHELSLANKTNRTRSILVAIGLNRRQTPQRGNPEVRKGLLTVKIFGIDLNVRQGPFFVLHAVLLPENPKRRLRRRHGLALERIRRRRPRGASAGLSQPYSKDEPSDSFASRRQEAYK